MDQQDIIPTIIRKYDPAKGDYAFENKLWHVLPFIKRLFERPIDIEIAKAKARVNMLYQRTEEQQQELDRMDRRRKFNENVERAKRTSPMVTPPGYWPPVKPFRIESKKFQEP